GSGHFFPNFGMVVSQNEWPPRTTEIDELIPIGVPQKAAVAPFDEERGAIYGCKRPYGRIYATGAVWLRFFIVFRRFLPRDITFPAGRMMGFFVATESFFK